MQHDSARLITPGHPLTGLLPAQESGQLRYGTAAVADPVFRLGRHLREGGRITVGNEKRVVTETAVAVRLGGDYPFDRPFAQVLPPCLLYTSRTFARRR